MNEFIAPDVNYITIYSHTVALDVILWLVLPRTPKNAYTPNKRTPNERETTRSLCNVCKRPDLFMVMWVFMYLSANKTADNLF